MQIMYKIEIHTPFGICHGWMMIQTENNDAVDGYLAVLNQIQPFFGHVEASGRLTLNCKLATRAQKYNVVLSGHADPNRVEMGVCEQHGRFDYLVVGSGDTRRVTIEQ